MLRLLLVFAACVGPALAQAAPDLARFSALPEAGFLARYPADSAAVTGALESYRERDATADGVYYAMHAPAGHDAAIVRWTLARLPMLSTPYYFLLSRRQFSSAPEEAVVWHLVAGVNAFYDAGRCALEESDEQVQHLFSINRQAIAWKEVLRERGELTPLLRRAVEWLEVNPGLPAPAYLCDGSLDTDRARALRTEAVAKLRSMVEDRAVPRSDPALKELVAGVMEARQDLLMTRLSLQNLAREGADSAAPVVSWAQEVDDDLLREYLSLAYLKYWDLEVAREAYDYHASPLGQKMLQNAINERLGLGGQYIRLSEAEDASFQEVMATPAMQRMRALRPAVTAYQNYLLRMAAGDPR